MAESFEVVESELAKIPFVNAIYCQRDNDGVLMIFAVVRERDIDAYDSHPPGLC